MSAELLIIIFLALFVCVLLIWQAVRYSRFYAQNNKLESYITPILERLEREFRTEISESARGTRTEISVALGQFQQGLLAQISALSSIQSKQMEHFSQQLVGLTDANERRLKEIRESVALQLAEVRQTLELKLRELQGDNATKLEEMRRTVDEKLHATLELRLSESFKRVSDQLESVHKGLGEMQSLAIGVGDLKRVLNNVKTRGTWGEVQLGILLEQVLTQDQYACNVKTVPGSDDAVEYAIRLPGQQDIPVWLPIDAKFPKEQYERLMDAQENSEPDAALSASRELERILLDEAKTIKNKYLAPPHTTDFAILFLPTEGLYAEIIRRPGLCDRLQREHRVTLAGPTTLTALLNSLQMGFRTLALEKRSSEVWQVLGAVKTEFGKFGDVLSKVRDGLENAAKRIGDAEVRTRQISRKLKEVEALSDIETERTLGISLETSGLRQNLNRLESEAE